MLRKLFDWLDNRTNFRRLRDAMLLEHIPGGARWRYVWGSCLAFVFLVQLITGILLMTSYSPGDTTAWGSVHFIQYQMDFGWLIRGLHHFGSQTMVVLLALHMLQVVIAGAHLPPREVNWWLGMLLLAAVLGLSLTGYLLPWDQKGYWATQVATNILGQMPVLGPFLQKVIVGGSEYGNQTLTHFYALHVGVLPPLVIVLIIAHLAVFRKHGVTAPANAQGEDMFWPKQAFKDMVASLAIFGIMVGLVVFGGEGNKIDVPEAEKEKWGWYENIARAGVHGLGADLDAPADPATEGYPARPEWYFLFLFQMLKYFKGDWEMIGTVVVPPAVGAVLFLLPLLGYGRMRRFGHFVGILVVVSLLAAVGGLTFLAVVDDSPEAILGFEAPDKEKALDFQKKSALAHAEAERAAQVAYAGIPHEGARDLLRKDPKTRGRALFKQNCAVCHSYTADPAIDGFDGFFSGKKASDLGGFGTEAWIKGLLYNPGDKKYFGHTELSGMKGWRGKINRQLKKWQGKEPKKIQNLKDDLDNLARFLAEQAKPEHLRFPKVVDFGLEKFKTYCFECHNISAAKKDKNKILHDENNAAPNLTGYGSAEWLRLMIMSPGHPLRHGDANTMPAFRNLDGPGAEVHQLEFQEKNKKTAVINLSDVDRELIIRFITRDYRVVFGGDPIAAPPLKEVEKK